MDDVDLFEEVVSDPDAAFPDWGWKSVACGWVATGGEAPCCASNARGHLYLYSDTPYCLKCHKCGQATGLSTVLQREGWDYGGALEELRRRLGLPARVLSDGELIRQEAAERRAELLERYLSFCQSFLPSCEKALEFLEGRGWTLEEAQVVGLGSVPPYSGVKSWAEEEGYAVGDLQGVNLWDRDGRLEERVVIPCRGRTGGRLEGLSLRSVDGREPKYYQAGSKANGAGLWSARGKGECVLVVEGDFDAAAVRARLPDTPVIALSGKSLVPETAAAAVRLGLQDFFLALDTDSEGQRAVQEAVQAIYRLQSKNPVPSASGIGVYVIGAEAVVRYGKDADEWTRTEEGRLALRQALRQAPAGWRWILDTTLMPRWQRAQTDWEKGQVIRQAKEFMVSLPPSVSQELVMAWQEGVGELSAAVVELAAVSERQARERESVDRLLRQLETDLRKLREESVEPVAVAARLRQAMEGVEGAVGASVELSAMTCRGALNAAAGLGEGRYCGWEKLESIGWRLRPAELSLVAARPGCGKTTFLSNICLNLLRDPQAGPVLFIQAELSAWQTYAFILAPYAAAVHHGKWTTGEIVRQFCRGNLDMELSAVAEAFDVLMAGRLFVVNEPLSPAQITVRAEAIEREQGRPLALVGVDYVELLESEARFDSAEQRVSSIADGLLSVAKENRVPVVALSQFNREASEEHGGRTEHLRYSDRLGALATNVLSLALPEEGQKEEESRPVVKMEVTAAKNRYGPKGANATLVWTRPQGILRDYLLE